MYNEKHNLVTLFLKSNALQVFLRKIDENYQLDLCENHTYEHFKMYLNLSIEVSQYLTNERKLTKLDVTCRNEISGSIHLFNSFVLSAVILIPLKCLLY